MNGATRRINGRNENMYSLPFKLQTIEVLKISGQINNSNR